MRNRLSTPKRRALAAASTAVLVVAATPQAADQKIDLATWDQSGAYGGMRATEFLGSEVRGKAGTKIGEVDSLHIDREGQVTGIVVESESAFDAGHVHFAVPWDDVVLGAADDAVAVPIDADNVAHFSLFRDDPKPRVAQWRATDLLHDLVYLASGDQYGIVEDLILNREGRIEAVVVSPDIGFRERARKAYPWYGPGYDAEVNRYTLPYDLREIELLGPFDYNAMKD